MQSHYIYKITNLINGKYYFGRRSTTRPIESDPYMGSGVLLKRAFLKYGIENFKKDIISKHSSFSELVEEEEKVVNGLLILDEMCYNMATGGRGKEVTLEQRERIRQSKLGKKRPDNSVRNKLNGFNKIWAGRKRTQSDKDAKSKSALASNASREKIILTCPHCQKFGDQGNMKRWHYDKCGLLERIP
jgi:hypothetical protein